MYQKHQPGFILLLIIFICHVASAHWNSQGISGQEHPVDKSSSFKQQYVFPWQLQFQQNAVYYQHIFGSPHTVHKSSLYEYQHVFSGLWQPQRHHKGVYLRHFGKETSQLISIHQREYSFQDQASLYGIGQCNLHETINNDTA